MEFDRYILEKTKCKKEFEKSKSLATWLQEDTTADQDWKIPSELLEKQQKSVLPQSYSEVKEFFKFWDEKYKTPTIRGDPVGKAKVEL